MTARREGFSEAQIPDLERRLANAIRIGTVSELDAKKGRVRVKVGKITTGWLRWSVRRAGPDREWSAPEVGEQVILASPSGDLAQAVVIGTIYQNKHPAPGDSENTTAYEWGDGAREEYDREGHVYQLTIPSGGKILMVIGGTTLELTNEGAKLKGNSLLVDCPETHFTGKVTSGGDMVASGVSLVKHVHANTMSGPGTSGKPVPGE